MFICYLQLPIYGEPEPPKVQYIPETISPYRAKVIIAGSLVLFFRSPPLPHFFLKLQSGITLKSIHLFQNFVSYVLRYKNAKLFLTFMLTFCLLSRSNFLEKIFLCKQISRRAGILKNLRKILVDQKC